jgi:hypothetical protein
LYICGVMASSKFPEYVQYDSSLCYHINVGHQPRGQFELP